MPGRTATLAFISALALIAAAYLPTVLTAGYVWDDWDLFILSPGLHQTELLWRTLSSPIFEGTTYLRPLVLATFALEFAVVGASPAVSHGVNLVVHLGTSALVGIAAIQLARSVDPQAPTWRAALIALLYGLHPALVEPVAWASGRFDLLVAFFGALSLVVFQLRHGVVRTLALPGVFLCAALSKEAAVVLPALWALVFLAQRPQMTWRETVADALRGPTLLPIGLCFFIGVAYLVFRQQALGELLHVDHRVTDDIASVSQHVGFVGLTLLHYAKTALIPFINISPQHPFALDAMTTSQTVMGMLAVVVTIAAALVALIRRNPVGLLMTGALVALLPVLNVIPLTIDGNIGHDRFLALPLVPLAMALALIRVPDWVPLDRTARWRRYGIALAVLFALTSFATVRSVVPLWASDASLWAWAFQKYPDGGSVRNNYAIALMSLNQLDEAQRVLGPLPESGGVTVMESLTRARLFVLSGDLERARRTLRAVAPLFAEGEAADGRRLDATRTYAIYLQTQGDIALATQDYAGALQWTGRMMQVAPRNLIGIRQRAMALAGSGKHPEAVAVMRRLDDLTPSTSDAPAWAAYARFLEILCKEDQRQDACSARKDLTPLVGPEAR